MDPLNLLTIESWSVDPRAAARTRKLAEDRLETSGNGTWTCCGGWRIEYAGVQPGRVYTFAVEVETEGVMWARDTLACYCVWEGIEGIRRPGGRALEHDFLFVRSEDRDRFLFTGTFLAPEGARSVTMHYVFRWTPEGKAVWKLPAIQVSEAPEPRPPVRVCVVTGKADGKLNASAGMDVNIRFYGGLCQRAVEEVRPDLIVLPEICLQWGVKGSHLDTAVSIPGPETDVFAEIARQGKAHIVVGALEKCEDGVYNVAALIGPAGGVVGAYRKVHLAEGGEWLSELTPGCEFPVFETGIGRIGFNICMDSSVAESPRMVGLQGADFLVMPIMGDLRANSCFETGWDFDPEKWKAIMRVRAMDNKLCMVVARNRSRGSCIVDARGDVLAWNEGDQDFVVADVPFRDFYRFRGFSQTHLNWFQRRPHLYGTYSDPYNYGLFPPMH